MTEVFSGKDLDELVNVVENCGAGRTSRLRLLPLKCNVDGESRSGRDTRLFTRSCRLLTAPTQM